jgi:hypothetical protein
MSDTTPSSTIVDLFAHDLHFESHETIRDDERRFADGGAEWRLAIFHAETDDDVHADHWGKQPLADEAVCCLRGAIRLHLVPTSRVHPTTWSDSSPARPPSRPATAGTASKSKSPPTSGPSRPTTHPAREADDERRRDTFVTSCHEVMTANVSRRGSGGT